MTRQKPKPQSQRPIPFPALPPTRDPNILGKPHQDQHLERLKKSMLSQHSRSLASPGIYPWLQGAADEAAAIAWSTPFPLLFLPALFEEKAQQAKTHAQRQARIQLQTRSLAKLAA